jgi:hypothetical protein
VLKHAFQIIAYLGVREANGCRPILGEHFVAQFIASGIMCIAVNLYRQILGWVEEIHDPAL